MVPCSEAAGAASLEALERGVEGAALERARLLWDLDQQPDAMLALQEVRCLSSVLYAPLPGMVSFSGTRQRCRREQCKSALTDKGDVHAMALG